MTDQWDDIRTAYDTVAEDYARLLPGPRVESPLDLALLDDFIDRVVDRGPVLDAGCGPGRMTRYLADHGVTVSGVDLSPEMVRVAQERHPDLEFTVGSIDRLQVQPHSCAGVLAWYSLIHTPPALLPAVIGELVRALMPGGWLLIGGQSGEGPRHIARGYGHDLDLTAHLHTAESFTEALREQGATVHTRLTRGPERSDRHPQAFVLAQVAVAGPYVAATA